MSYYVWNLLRDVYLDLGQMQVGKADDGSTTAVVDNNLAGKGKDDDWNDGAVIILEADGAAPEGEFGRVSDYKDQLGILTIEALTAAVASGDVYGLVSAYYPLHQMIELVNAALKGLGDIVKVDTYTLDTAADQTEYAAAVAWKRRPPYRVDIQTNKSEANDNRWKRLHDWYYVPAAAGNTGLIVFRTQLPEGYDLRVWYQDVHPRVDAYNDVIDENIHPELAKCAVVEKALKWQASRLSGSDNFLLQQLNDARADLDRAMMLHPVWKPGRVSRGLGIGRK